jgi:hypothetical protein
MVIWAQHFDRGCVHNPTVCCLHQRAWPHLVQRWRGNLVREGNSVGSSKCFLYVSMTLSCNPQDSAVSLKQFNFWPKKILIKQNLTFTQAVPLWQTMHFYLQQSRCLAVVTWTKQWSGGADHSCMQCEGAQVSSYLSCTSTQYWHNVFPIHELENISPYIIETNKCTYMKFVLYFINYEHVSIAFVIIIRVALEEY